VGAINLAGERNILWKTKKHRSNIKNNVKH
jgi:hypothetical protein